MRSSRRDTRPARSCSPSRSGFNTVGSRPEREPTCRWLVECTCDSLLRNLEGGLPVSNRLAGKVAIITGTDGSMGREAAPTFTREGALVVGCDLRIDDAQATVEAVRAAGGTMVSLHPCDLS